MPSLTSQQANDLANNFLNMAKAIGDFRYKNWQFMSVSENQQTGDLQWKILNYGEEILVLSTILVMNDIENSLKEINDISSQIHENINTLQNIQKGINVAAAVVILGAAIVSKNPQSIVDATVKVVNVWKA